LCSWPLTVKFMPMTSWRKSCYSNFQWLMWKKCICVIPSEYWPSELILSSCTCSQLHCRLLIGDAWW
jgi:hypothetical protein